MKIAFVEDDRDWSSAICEILEYEGHSVVPFLEPEMPEKTMFQFDLVICDNKLEEIDSGIEYISKLRDSGYKGLLLLYTSFSRPQLEERCDRVDAYLINKVDDISHALSKILEIERKSEQLNSIANAAKTPESY